MRTTHPKQNRPTTTPTGRTPKQIRRRRLPATVARTLRGLAASAVLIVAASAALAPAAQTDPGRVCFPRSTWDADPQHRPCAEIVRLYEDGSLKVRVSDANGTPRYSYGVGALDR